MHQSKIAFIVDSTILNSHVGVRRYVLSILYQCKDFADLLVVEYTLTGKPFFTQIVISSERIKSNLLVKNYFAGDTKKNIIENLNDVYLNISSKELYLLSDDFSLPIGCAEFTKYSVLIWSAPWIYQQYSSKAFKHLKQYVIGYDAIPNLYSIDHPFNKDLLSFGNKHKEVYAHFLDMLDGIIAISKTSKIQLSNIFPDYAHKIFEAGVIVPAGYSSHENPKININKKKEILLASPLDPRKGLNILPSYINGLNCQKLSIFGAPRCPYEYAYDFFANLNITDIEWWPNVSYEKQLELYQNASFVLFPSHDEGLGLPVIEAQNVGTPVFVSNIHPLIDLVNEEFVLSGDISVDTKKMNKFLNQNEPSSLSKIKKVTDTNWFNAIKF